MGFSPPPGPEPPPPPADSGSTRPDAAARPLRPAVRSPGVHPHHPACHRGDFAATGGHRIPLPPGAGTRSRAGWSRLKRAAPRLRARAAGGSRSHSAPRVEGGARTGEGRRGTAADSDPGRAGPRLSAAATRSPQARKCAPDPAPPPTRPLFRSRRPEKGRTVTSASGPCRQPASAPSGGHTQRPGRRRGLGGPGCGTRGPGRASVPAAQAPPRPPQPRIPARARRAGRGSRAAAAGSPGLTSVRSAGRSVPGRGTATGGAVAGGGAAAAAAPAARRAGRAGAAAWAARRPELARCCRRLRRRAQPARPPDWIPSLTQLRVGPLHAGTLPPLTGCPRPPAGQPAPQCHSPRRTHPEPAPLAPARTHRAAHASLGFCIRSHARSDTDAFPLHALLAPFPTPLSRRIPVRLLHFACLPHTYLLAFP